MELLEFVSKLQKVRSLPAGFVYEVIDVLRAETGDNISMYEMPLNKEVVFYNQTKGDKLAYSAEYIQEMLAEAKKGPTATEAYNGWDKYYGAMYPTVLPENKVGATFKNYAVDWAKAPDMSTGKKKEAPPKTHDILIVAGTKAEAAELADMMGWGADTWVYVHRFEVMLQYPSRSVYIYGTARERKDFGAIEGLFMRGGHEVMDMDE